MYDKPSSWDWEKALPVGNGRLGGMIYGEMDMEHIQLNEETVWSGGFRNRINPDAKSHLEEVRKLIFAGDIPEAEQLLKFAFTGTPQSEPAYQTLGDLYIDLMETVQEPGLFSRELDLKNALHTVRVTDVKTGINYKRECFVSAVDQVLVTRIEADKEASVKAAAMITRQCMEFISKQEKDTIYWSGSTGKDAIDFCVGLRMKAIGGEASVLGEHVICYEADAIELYVAVATSYREKELEEAVRETLDHAVQKGYEKIKQDHMEEYSRCFSTCKLELKHDITSEKVPTDMRLQAVMEGEEDLGLVNLYFDYGRYLLLSSSRPGTLPANLQGIWNGDLTPPWGSKYTININTEMNYWPAESLGLSDCHLPLFDHIERMMEKGKVVAREMYGCGGWVAHHNTDLWGDCAPQDMYIPATYWVMGGAWLCTHIWEHYEYTQDQVFLEKMYPAIRGAIEFFMDFLVEHDGYYVTCPSVSPENTYILPSGKGGCYGYGVTMDNEILYDLLHIGKKAGKIVGESSEFLNQISDILSKLPSIRTGSQGQILEWMNEYEEAEPGHRHISHLYGLYPSSQIQVGATPELVEGAKITLQRRLASGGGHTGWSRAWMIAMYARLWDGESAYENIKRLFQKSTLSNLLDNHPPFQIDGNFGATAAIGEMLVQSNNCPENTDYRVVILPAVPKAWKTGELCGMRIRGGASVHIKWEEGELTFCEICAEYDYHGTVEYCGVTKEIEIPAGQSKQIFF